MTTTYAVMLSAISWTDAVRQHVVDLVESWADELPRAGNAHLKFRRGDRDPVYRVQYTEMFRPEGLERHTTVTVLPHRGSLAFEARVTEVTTRGTVEPVRSRPALPRRNLLQLVGEVAGSVTAYDAERRITPSPHAVAGFVGGQSLAAHMLAPGRRLPIVVESTVGRSSGAERTAGLAPALVGIAHVAHLVDTEAIRGLNDLYGADLGTATYPVIVWPGSHEPLALSANARPTDFLAPILAAAATMTPLPVTQLTREARADTAGRPVPRDHADPTVPPSTAAPITGGAHHQDGPVVAELQQTIDALRAQHDENRLHIEILDEIVEQIESERDELRDRVDERDEEIDALTADVSALKATVEKLKGIKDQLIARTVEYELERDSRPAPIVVNTVADAIKVAMERSSALEFAPEALETAKRLEGPDPRMLLKDLAKLDRVVLDWRNNKVTLAGLASWATGTANLDYAPSIGEDAARRHADYYCATWNGRLVPLRAHLRRGKFARMIRVYLHVDAETKTIVVGKVDRHGPDGTT